MPRKSAEDTRDILDNAIGELPEELYTAMASMAGAMTDLFHAARNHTNGAAEAEEDPVEPEDEEPAPKRRVRAPDPDGEPEDEEEAPKPRRVSARVEEEDEEPVRPTRKPSKIDEDDEEPPRRRVTRK